MNCVHVLVNFIAANAATLSSTFSSSGISLSDKEKIRFANKKLLFFYHVNSTRSVISLMRPCNRRCIFTDVNCTSRLVPETNVDIFLRVFH